MAQIDKDRFHSMSMAKCYDKMTDYLVPQYHFLQDQVISMLIADRQPNLIVDLGAGSGVFLEKILKSCPTANAVWIDYSQDFKQVAMERLSPFTGRVQFLTSSFNDDWPAALPQQPDVICSMNAIHHMESQDKRSLYTKCFKAITHGGWFFNIDEMSTMYEDAYRKSLDYWVCHVRQARQSVPENLESYARVWCDKFDSWKLRNVENAGQPKLPGDDIHESFIDQVQWLHAAGFVNVDLFIKFQLWSVIGGQKPYG